MPRGELLPVASQSVLWGKCTLDDHNGSVGPLGHTAGAKKNEKKFLAGTQFLKSLF